MPDNKAFVQSLYAAFGRGDIPFILAHIDGSIEWISSCSAERIPWGGIRKGRAGAQSFFQALAEHLAFERFEPRDFRNGRRTACARTTTGITRCSCRTTGSFRARSR